MQSKNRVLPRLADISRHTLVRLARRDRRDLLRPALVAAHRALPPAAEGSGSERRKTLAPAGAGTAGMVACEEPLAHLILHTLPGRDGGILLLGAAAAAADHLRQLGYTRICAGGVMDVARPPDPSRLLSELRRFAEGEFETSALISLLPELPADMLAAALQELARVTRRWIAAVLPVYPHALAGAPAPGRLERPEWWDARFAPFGFTPAPWSQDPTAPYRQFLYERKPEEAFRRSGVQAFGIDHRRTTNDQRPTHDAHRSSLVVRRWSIPNARTPERLNAAPLTVHFDLDVSAGNAFTWLSVEFARALEEAGHRVSWTGSEITGTLPEGERERLRQWMAAECGDVSLTWSHYWPQYARRPPEGSRRFEQFAVNYRFRGAREEEWDAWMRQICASRSTFLPLSRFCREALRAVGIPAERCPVLPIGYSSEIDRVPDAVFLPVERSFRFLATTNCGDWRRYGTDLLLEAFARAFRPGDDVCLVLRDYGGNTHVAHGYPHELAARIATVRERGLELFYFSRFLSKEDMIRFHRACHAFVAPFRGEGFGVKVLDAMACDLPAILPLYSGPADFCSSESCFPVPFHEVPVSDCLDTHHLRIGNDPVWCEVDVDALAETLRSVYRDPDAARARGRRAGEAARRDYSWPAVCRRFAELAR